MLEKTVQIEDGLAEEIINSNLETNEVASSDLIPNRLFFDFSPMSGPVGTRVTLTGLNFVNVSRVRFNGVDASFTIETQKKIFATVPLGATNGPISVDTQSGRFPLTLTSRKPYFVNPRGPVVGPGPIITSVAPNTGGESAVLSIRGENFVDIVSVTFTETPNGPEGREFRFFPASFEVVSPILIKTIVPAELGRTAITVKNKDNASATTTDFRGPKVSLPPLLE